MDEAYLLVDEVLVVVLDVEFSLHLLDFGPLQEDLPLNGKHLLSSQLTLAHQGDKLPGIFELLPQPPQLFGTLSISATSLPDLPDLAPTEANIWVGIIGVLSRLELYKPVSDIRALLPIVDNSPQEERFTLRLGINDRFPVVILRDFQCSYTSLANRFTDSSTAASMDSCMSSKLKTGGLSTAANGCFVCAVSSKKFMTSSNWSSVQRLAGSRFWFMILRKTSSSSVMLYGHPQQSSTVEEKRMYVAGCEKVGG